MSLRTPYISPPRFSFLAPQAKKYIKRHTKVSQVFQNIKMALLTKIYGEWSPIRNQYEIELISKMWKNVC